MEDGLPQSTVRAILQDARGFLWIGTQDGLSRFDGQGFEIFTYDPADPRSLPGNTVFALHEDGSGRLWVGTADGLARLDPVPTPGGGATPSFERVVHGGGDPALPSDEEVLALEEGTRGGLWVGTRAGLAFVAPGAGTLRRIPLPRPPGDADPGVGALLVDPWGQVWAGGTGLWVRYTEGDGFREVRGPGGRRLTAVAGLQLDRDGLLWVVAAEGLHRVSPGARPLEVHPVPLGVPEAPPTTLHVDAAGTLWVGSRGGLARADPVSGRVDTLAHDPADPASLGAGRGLGPSTRTARGSSGSGRAAGASPGRYPGSASSTSRRGPGDSATATSRGSRAAGETSSGWALGAGG